MRVINAAPLFFRKLSYGSEFRAPYDPKPSRSCPPQTSPPMGPVGIPIFIMGCCCCCGAFSSISNGFPVVLLPKPPPPKLGGVTERRSLRIGDRGLRLRPRLGDLDRLLERRRGGGERALGEGSLDLDRLRERYTRFLGFLVAFNQSGSIGVGDLDCSRVPLSSSSSFCLRDAFFTLKYSYRASFSQPSPSRGRS